jgi:hypothetical protein
MSFKDLQPPINKENEYETEINLEDITKIELGMSENKTKKYWVIISYLDNKQPKKKTVNFGSKIPLMSDYTIHKDAHRRLMFWVRTYK